jgi:tetratricopeptide (TPR) repeat protein
VKAFSPGQIALTAICLFGPLGAQDPPPTSRPQDSLQERAIGAERSGDVAAAAKLFLELFDAEPNKPEWAVAAGRCLGLAGQYNDAIDLLDNLRERFPDVLEIRSMLARTFLLKAENMLGEGIRDLNVELYLRDAVITCEEILANAPGHRDARLILTQSLLQLGEQDEALRHGEEAAKRFASHPGGHILVGRISFERFAALRTRIIEERPTGQLQADLIQRAYEQREKARKAFESAIAADPNRAYPHRMLGDLQSWLGNAPAAMGHYRRALMIDPRTPIGHQWLSQNVDADGRLAFYTSAVEAYTRQPDANPARAAFLEWYVGKALADQESWEQAQLRFERVVEHLPEDTGSLYWAMLCAYRAEDLEAAEGHAAAHAKLKAAGFADLIRGLSESDREDVVDMLTLLAGQSYNAERLEHSRDINRVLAYLINSAKHWNNYAFLCRETGLFEDSLSAYQRALQREPDSPQLLNDTGVILQYHLTSPENLERAREYYRRAIAMAEGLLAEPETEPDVMNRARQALLDAKANLANMKTPAPL